MLTLFLDGTGDEIFEFYQKFLIECQHIFDDIDYDDIDFEYYMHESGIKFRVRFFESESDIDE